MNWFELLQVGDRKQIGESKTVAKKILADPKKTKPLLKYILKNCDNAIIVSHGFYALKEASTKSSQICKEALSFCKKNINYFEQWEACENFLRIALIDIKKDQGLLKKIEPMIEDKSAIVQSYAAEYLIRYAHKFNQEQIKPYYLMVKRHGVRASVKARLKKIAKELELKIE